MPRSVLRIKESKQPVSPGKRGDSNWCTYCNRLIQKSIFEQHQRERHNVDLEADKRQKKPKILVEITVSGTRPKKDTKTRSQASTSKKASKPAIRLSQEIRKNRTFRKRKGSRRFSGNSSVPPKLKPQSPPKPHGTICARCERPIPHGELAKHNCNPPKNPVSVRKLSSLPRKQKYVKIKRDFKSRLSDVSGGWY